MSETPAIGTPPEPDRTTRWLRAAQVSLYRLIAVALMLGALLLWSRFFGFGVGFALTDTAERGTVLALAALLPVAALGLWLVHAWGAVLWLAAAALHAAAVWYGAWPATGYALAFNLVAAALFAALLVALAVHGSRARRLNAT